MCLIVTNKPVKEDRERTNSIVNSLERQEGMGPGAEVERLPKEKKEEGYSFHFGRIES